MIVDNIRQNGFRARCENAVRDLGPIVTDILSEMGWPEQVYLTDVLREYLERTGQFDAAFVRAKHYRPDSPDNMTRRYNLGVVLEHYGYTRITAPGARSARFRRVSD